MISILDLATQVGRSISSEQVPIVLKVSGAVWFVQVDSILTGGSGTTMLIVRKIEDASQPGTGGTRAFIAVSELLVVIASVIVGTPTVFALFRFSDIMD